jgi:cytoskeletal protein RodZ
LQVAAAAQKRVVVNAGHAGVSKTVQVSGRRLSFFAHGGKTASVSVGKGGISITKSIGKGTPTAAPERKPEPKQEAPKVEEKKVEVAVAPKVEKKVEVTAAPVVEKKVEVTAAPVVEKKVEVTAAPVATKSVEVSYGAAGLGQTAGAFGRELSMRVVALLTCRSAAAPASQLMPAFALLEQLLSLDGGRARKIRLPQLSTSDSPS